MLLLSLLRLRVPPRILFRMPPVAGVTTGTMGLRRSGRTRTVVNYAHQVTVEEREGPIDTAVESPLTDLGSEGVAESPPKKKRRKRTNVIEPVVYDIPPVETKTTSFKGMDGVSMGAYSRVYTLKFRPFGIRAFRTPSMSYAKPIDRSSRLA